MDIKLRGRGVNKGKVEGEAVVCQQPVAFLSWEPAAGVICQPGGELHGKSVKDKVVVYPCGCGGVGYPLYTLKEAGGGPKAIVNMKPYHQELVDAVLTQIPMVHGFDRNLLEIVKTGDHVTVDADEGIITVSKRS